MQINILGTKKQINILSHFYTFAGKKLVRPLLISANLPISGMQILSYDQQNIYLGELKSVHDIL